MELFFKSILVYLMVVLGSALLGFLPLWALWNWLIPEIFDLPKINPLQSFGLVLLAGCLLGSVNPWSRA